MEPFLMFGLIIAYIWKLRAIHPNFWTVIPALMFLSHLLHQETPRALGFKLHGLASHLKQLAPLLALIAAVMLSMGALLHTLRPIGFAGVLLALLPYLPWGLTQQYILNGYFLNRFDALLSPGGAGLLAALLFSAAHAPNPFLMAVTLPLGWSATLLYRRTRNLYLLGIAHAVIGLLLFLVVPDSISHHLRVGPGWFRPY
jgi:membrane protease YdiL (CAAX protease family)